MNGGRANIVQVAIRIIAGPGKGQVDRAAKILGVSSATLYRWLRAGNMLGARGAEVLCVHDLTDVPLEPLLGADGYQRAPVGLSGGIKTGLFEVIALRVFISNPLKGGRSAPI
jgi:hypothetical protein